MAKIDRVKEFINYLKVLLVLSLATMMSLIVNNYQIKDVLFIYSAIVSVFMLIFVSLFLNKKIIKDIKSLEDLG